MRRKLGEIINELKGAISDHDMKVPDEIIFSEAVSCYRGIMAGRSKSPQTKSNIATNNQGVVEGSKTAGGGNNAADNTITPKQKNFIEKNRKEFEALGFKVDLIDGKDVAKEVINNFIKMKDAKKKQHKKETVDAASTSEDLYDEDSMYL